MKLRFATQKHTDNRIKLINEVLKGIKVVKTYACKNPDADASTVRLRLLPRLPEASHAK